MKYETAQYTLMGDRSMNQDRYLIMEAPDAILLALADGMGGHPKGEKAAQILMDNARKAFLTSRKPISNPRFFLSGLMEMSHREILDFGARQEPAIEPRTTGVLCLVQEESAYWAHIGDSRLYIMRDGVIHLRTDDHSYVEHLRQQGLISAAQVHTHKFRNYVTRCLGGTNNRPVAELSGPHELQEGDVVLLCSDGFWGPLAERPMVDALYKEQASLVKKIAQLANEAAATSHPESDNVTVVALRWRESEARLSPADVSMSLSRKKRDLLATPAEQVDVTNAINDLRKFVDDIDVD
ncbi:MAG: serine/threonine-protein phosphatase [gamma proteobacterium symbiont of Ctena orbiculata]|nr:protein phosphatase 2C domain-containing protein [Candidatus Thiodiazotropha taylori]MBT3058897.1 protein phosphatase 2C domain-containing protein [Candidatus Thiodiazotropha sp. (ex Lucina pensylvanica)]MBV2096071.1 protein phosphatase 2C domain-containing protein [Candidatus Thiodiazotropha sp. (ex Codakia orbicularis)]PUB75783.1 MAG: serine/threonine-protein phosphatase [gamma proteobacterium symbiont of Ctena orbiculata]MBT3063112.1 protein phosphatase 2C domain-containing protein [Candi